VSRARSALTLVVSVLLVLSAGCTRTSETPRKPGPSVWDTTLEEIGDDGTVSLATALKAFALAIAPLPGVSVPDTERTIVSGTIAVNWVLAHWAELTPDQQNAVEAALNGPVTPRAPRPYTGLAAAPTGPNVDCLTADTGDAAPFRALIDGIKADIAAHLGPALFASPDSPRRSEDFRLFLSVNTKQLYDLPDRPAKMYTFPCQGGTVTSAGDDIPGCTIHVNPESLKAGYTDHDRRSFLIHEVMHCVLLARLGKQYVSIPAWYEEGVPTWVMTVLGGGDAASAPLWNQYLDTSTKSLYKRSYDGVGFFAHLAETGTDVWSRIDPIGRALKGGNNKGGWDAAAPTESFLDSWGPGYVRGRYPGTPWNTGGPGLPTDHKPDIPAQALANDAAVSVDAPVAGIGIKLFDVSAEVLTVAPDGAARGRFATGLGHDMSLAEAAGTVFCAKPGGCTCPEGSEGVGTQFTQLTGGPNYVGVTGGPEKASVRLAGESLDNYCKKKRTPCVVGNWTGVGYDLAAEGQVQHGGAGVRLVVEKTGQMTVTFDGMAPVVFQTTTPGTEFTGSYVYNGSASGRVNLPPAGASSGTWDPVSGGESFNITATVSVTSPVAITLGPLDLASIAGALGGAGGAVGAQPFGPGGWTCSGDRMVITPLQGSGVTGTWTLQRTG
jgi:hypothetical protein